MVRRKSSKFDLGGTVLVSPYMGDGEPVEGNGSNVPPDGAHLDLAAEQFE
jgi:hypothetical protein